MEVIRKKICLEDLICRSPFLLKIEKYFTWDTNSNKYISGARLASVKKSHLKNLFTKDVIEVGNGPDDNLQYKDFINLDHLDPLMKSRPLYIHMDMSVTGDKTGIAGSWICGKKPPKPNEPPSKELYFRLAFSVSVKAPKGYQISFEKNRQFIYWLKDQGFNIKGISTDTYQSVDTGQTLASKGYNYCVLSMDRVDSDRICKPYQYLRSTIYEERIEMYDAVLLTDELIGLQRDMNSGKIDHDPSGINSKDQADAVCGSVWNAAQHAEEYEFDYGENIETTISVNRNSDVAYEQQQITVDFEAEMMKILDPMQKPSTKVENAVSAKSEYNKYMDFGLGPATALPPNAFLSDGIIVW